MVLLSPLVAPSLLAANFLHLYRDIDHVVQAGADWLHLDIMDGHYVPNLSFGPDWVKQIKNVTSVPLDVHLMVDCLDFSIDAFAKAGADHITIHPQATYHPYRCLQKIKSHGLKAGIALTPGTPIEVLAPLSDQLDLILVMTVNPGFGGQHFLPSCLETIQKVRDFIDQNHLSIQLQVDGGINDQTSKQVLEKRADVLVVGNYLFKDNPTSLIETYRTRLEKIRHYV